MARADRSATSRSSATRSSTSSARSSRSTARPARSTASGWSTAARSYGIGLESSLLGFPMHFDWSWKTLFNRDWEDVLFAADAWFEDPSGFTPAATGSARCSSRSGSATTFNHWGLVIGQRLREIRNLELRQISSSRGCSRSSLADEFVTLTLPSNLTSDVSPKRPSDSSTEMVQVVLPNDANPLGFILGGTVMHLIDIAGAIACHRHTRSLLVTAAVDGLQFLHPIKVGDLIILRATVTAAFTTSLEVEVEVFSESTLTGERQLTSLAYLTFVTIDREGGARPGPAAAARDRRTSAGRPRDAEVQARRAARGQAAKRRTCAERRGREAVARLRSCTRPSVARPASVLIRLRVVEPDAPHRVVAALLEHEPRALARGRDVLAQVDAVDRPPDLARGLDRPRRPTATRSGGSSDRGSLEHRLAQRQERDRRTTLRCRPRRRRCRSRSRRSPRRTPADAGPAAVARLQHVQALDDDDVGPIDDLELAGDDVVGLVGIDRRVHGAVAGLDVAS